MFIPVVFIFLLGIRSTQSAPNATIQLAWNRTLDAVALPQNLLGFSIESDRFPDFAGNGTQRNDFTYALLGNLKRKTGVAPPIRVGGGTQDRGIFTPNIIGDPGYYNIFPAVSEQYNTTKQLFPECNFEWLGPHYWLSSCNLPEGTSFTWGVNLRAANASEAAVQVGEIERTFALPECKHVKLNNFDIGNEPDSWPGTQFRPSGWNITNHVDQQNQFFDTINEALGNNGRKYRIADFAEKWSTKQLINTAIMESPMGRYINAVSEHHYQHEYTIGYSLTPSKWPIIAENLTNTVNVRKNIARYIPSVAAARNTSIPFVLGETNSIPGHGQPGVSNTAAAALWTIDYSLQAASRGVATLFYHQGVGYNYSAFVPVDHVGSNITDWSPTAKRHVMPAYYGLLAVADAIGSTGSAYINEVATNVTNLAVYQIWEGAKLERIMIINAVPWTEGSTGRRPSLSISFPDVADRSTKGAKFLTFTSLSAQNGLTWGGQSWENYDGVADGETDLEELDADGLLVLPASSAALLYL